MIATLISLTSFNKIVETRELFQSKDENETKKLKKMVYANHINVLLAFCLF